MDHVRVIFQPTGKQLNEVKNWLIEEDKVSKDGFFCNWSIIADSFENKKLGVILKNKSVIGFITWFDFGRVTNIQIAEIKPEFRRMGYGKILAETLFDELKKQGVAILKLHCQTAISEKAWKKLGFKQFPAVEDFEDYNSEDGKHLYKILIPFTSPTKSVSTGETIELWSVEPHQISGFEPEWRWIPKFKKKSRKLVKPIIFPANKDWNIRWMANNNIIKDTKVKRFGKTDIDYSRFMIIEELPLR